MLNKFTKRMFSFHILVQLSCIIWIFLIATGCSEETPEIWEGNENISFSTEEIEKAKSAINKTTDFVDGSSFGVYGAFSINKTNFSKPTTVFDNRQVKLENRIWSYSPIELWKKNKHYRFQAFYPYADQAAENPEYILTTSFGTSNTFTITNFIVKDAVSQQTDLLVSDVIGRSSKGNFNKSVGFTFHHLLTKINVKLKINQQEMDKKFTEGWKITKLYAKLYGMKTKGTCTDEIWNTDMSLANEVGYTKFFTNTKEGLFPTPTSEIIVWKEKDQDGLLMIPQTDLTPIKLDVGFFIEYKEGGVIQKTFIDNITPIPTKTSWDNAKQITYVATLDASTEIKFLSPKVEPWSVSKNSNSVIIK